MGHTPTTDHCTLSSTIYQGGHHTSAHWSGQEFLLTNRKLISSFNFIERDVVDGRGGQARYLLNLICHLEHVWSLLFVQFHAPPTDMRTFKFRLWSHMCWQLLFAIRFFTVVHFRYYVVPRINGFLCKNKSNEIVDLQFSVLK